MENVTEKSGKVRNDLKKDILAAVSCIKNEFESLKSVVLSTNRRINELESRAAETHALLQAFIDGVGGNCSEVRVTSSGPRVNFKKKEWRTADPAGGTRKRYSDVAADRRTGERGQETPTTQVDQSKEKEDEKGNHTETQAKELTPNPNLEEEDEGEMEDLVGFEAVTYRRNHRKQRQQVIIGTSRDSEIKAEKKKAWIYLGRMDRETTVERVKNFLNMKGIKEEIVVEELRTMGPCKAFKLGFPFEHLQLTENSEFWPQGAIIRPFRFSYRARRQHRGATIDTDM